MSKRILVISSTDDLVNTLSKKSRIIGYPTDDYSPPMFPILRVKDSKVVAYVTDYIIKQALSGLILSKVWLKLPSRPIAKYLVVSDCTPNKETKEVINSSRKTGPARFSNLADMLDNVEAEAATIDKPETIAEMCEGIDVPAAKAALKETGHPVLTNL